MQILTYIVILIITLILTATIGKLAMHLFTKRITGYTTSLLIIVITQFIFYTAVLIFGSLIAFTINTVLGIIIAIFLLIGTIGAGYRTLLKDAHHSMSIARDRRAN